MKIPRKLGIVIFILCLAGLSLFIILIARHGVSDIVQAFAQAGWGLLAVLAAHCFTRLFDTLSWRALIPREHRPSLWRLLFIHWIGDSVSSMLPVAQVGGEVIRVRMLSKTPSPAGGMVPLPVATSSVLVGMTISLATQIIFLLSGLACLVALTGHRGLTMPILLAAAVSLLCAFGFYAVQRVGIFQIITRIVSHVAAGDAWEGLASRGAELDADIRACYARGPAVIACAWWNMCTWAAGGLEVWAALWALGIDANYAEAYVLESINQGIRSAMFLVPGALGFQEGGYLVVGRLLGISAPGALALSLIRRAREISFGIPGVVVWQWLEGRHFWFRRCVSSVAALPDKAP